MFFSRGLAQKPGWLALSFQPQGICVAHVQRMPGGKPAVRLCRVSEGSPADARALEKLAKELHLGQYRCTTLLKLKEYQMLLVEAPSVPEAEMKTAIRWRVKDMLDYKIDDATVDVLDIPPGPDAPAKGRSLYAVAARNEIIQRLMALFDQAGLPLSVIDIPEMAQRNMASLLEENGRGLAMLSFGAEEGLLTVNYGGELYLSRHIEVALSHLQEEDAERRRALFEKVTLELQRSLDHFDRQFHFIGLGKLVLAPLPGVEGLREYLAERLYLPVEEMDLAELLDFSAAPELTQPAFQAQCFFTLGAALRVEEIAL